MLVVQNVIKDPHWYAVNECDATMLNQGFSAWYQKIKNGRLKQCMIKARLQNLTAIKKPVAVKRPVNIILNRWRRLIKFNQQKPLPAAHLRHANYLRFNFGYRLV